MSFYRACSASDVDEGEAVAVDLVGGNGIKKTIAVVRDEDGKWHAIDDKCPHGDVSLAEGDVEDDVIECWAHGATFNLHTGKETLPATAPVCVYPVEVRDGDIYVDVDAKS